MVSRPEHVQQQQQLDEGGATMASIDVMPPRAIMRLPQDVVNRIAAGEIIQRPANALKEMIENSLDAGAQMIRIQLRDGGLSMLQIQDDGHGVSRADLPLLCERFATSKLRSFADLAKMTTFGFRGEALASISYVSASMSVVSKTKHSALAYKACYAAGKLVAPKPGQSAEPKPCAGSTGTFITAEDLFYNVPQRKRALKSATEEYSLALDVVSKYAVHYGGRGIGFSCKKSSSSMVDLSVPSSDQTTTIDVVSMIYGSKVANELLRLESIHNSTYKVTMEGYVSNSSWHSKRAMFLLFINNRLVDAPALRRSVLALYATVLPKGAHPWIYISLHIDEANVDVNVHPTKREVHFLNEEDIIETLCTHLQTTLMDANSRQTFVRKHQQSTLTGLEAGGGDGDSISAQVSKVTASVNPTTPSYPQHMIRVDARTRTLDEMGAVTRTRASDRNDSDSSLLATARDDNTMQNHGDDEDGFQHLKQTDGTASQAWSAPESDTSLESVHELRENVHEQRHVELTEILRNHTLVGIVGTDKASLLLQHRTKLFLVRYPDVIREVAYQLALRQFGQLSSIKLHPAPALKDVLLAAMQAETSESHNRRQTLGITKKQAVERAEQILCDKADMLQEYFGITIKIEKGGSYDDDDDDDDDDGRAGGNGTYSRPVRLVSLPNILRGHHLTQSQPRMSSDQEVIVALQLTRVPSLMLRLATQANYVEEKACFASILHELAWAHTPITTAAPTEGENDGNVMQNEGDADAATEARVKRDWSLIWAPAMRMYTPSRTLAKSGAVTMVTSLPSLYSVFERC